MQVLGLCRKEGACGKVELSVRYQEHSEENNLLGTIKQQVRNPSGYYVNLCFQLQV